MTNPSYARRFLPWAVIALCLALLLGMMGYAAYEPVFCEISGTDVVRDGNVTLDKSNAANGYIMVKHSGTSKRLKMRLYYGPGLETFQTFDINNEGRYESFPLMAGSGTYKVLLLENVKDTSYASIFSKEFTVQLNDELAPFLCPNEYVWYTSTMQAVQKSYELCYGIEDDWTKVEVLYQFVSTTVIYDYIKSLTVRNPYYSVVDDTLTGRMGICLDYSALLACMLRVQGIPTQVVVGELIPTNQNHAWNKVYLGGSWLQLDATFPNGMYKQGDYAEKSFY